MVFLKSSHTTIVTTGMQASKNKLNERIVSIFEFVRFIILKITILFQILIVNFQITFVRSSAKLVYFFMNKQCFLIV